MKDRISAKPGRVLITPESGTEAYYATVTMADEPTEAGTPPTKNNLLKDSTAGLFGLSDTATVDDVLVAISSRINALLQPEIYVTSYSGAEITARKGDKVVTAIENDGVWIFKIPEYGEWTISGTFGTLSKTAKVNVDSVKRYELPFEFVDDGNVWSNNTWEQIAVAINSGNVPAEWINSIMAEDSANKAHKTLQTSDGLSGEVYVIGINHDTYTSGGIAPFTFLWIPSTSYKAQWHNSGNASATTWETCSCRTDTLPQLLSTMGYPFTSYIKAVNKLYGNADGTYHTASDYLSLPSNSELSSSYSEQGSKYGYLPKTNIEVSHTRSKSSSTRVYYFRGDTHNEITVDSSTSGNLATERNLGVIFSF